MYDAIVVGGGPAGLSAALMLGRARRNVLLVDGGTPRNSAATEVHGFVTRDGTSPREFRRVAREQLAPYQSVTLASGTLGGIEGEKGHFRTRLDSQIIEARRVLLCTGMVDLMPEIPGYRELWGHAIFKCPYCHGFEVRDRPFGFIAPMAAMLEHALFLQNWSRDMVVFTDGRFPVESGVRSTLELAGCRIEERPIVRLVTGADAHSLVAVEVAGGARVEREILFAAPPQRQTELVAQLALPLDELGYVRIDAQHETERRGIYAAGDLTTMVQSAVIAAAQGSMAGHWLNHGLVQRGAADE
jgi:thioredoxin reductase